MFQIDRLERAEAERKEEVKEQQQRNGIAKGCAQCNLYTFCNLVEPQLMLTYGGGNIAPSFQGGGLPPAAYSTNSTSATIKGMGYAPLYH